MISLLCTWKAGAAKPILNLAIWDRQGQALAFQYQGHAANIATRKEQRTEVNGVNSALTKEQLAAASTFRAWNGILHETIGPALSHSQIELLCDTATRFRAYLQISQMCDAAELRRIAADICDSLVIENPDRWQATNQCTVETMPS
jgi:hypothetical protein